MKQLIKEYFTFNKRERNGVFILCSIIVLQLVWLGVSDRFVSAEQMNFESFRVDELQLLKVGADSSGERRQHLSAPAFFDPNTADDEVWRSFGLSQKQIAVIRRFLARGKKFRDREDVKKMYCINEQTFAKMSPFLRFNAQTGPRTAEAVQKKLLDLNSCDSADLTQLKGVGPFYARKIIQYRTELGGYVRKEQLLELWKFDEEKFARIREQITVDSLKARKIRINSCSAEELRHPYLSWKVVNAIINYRKHHGPYRAVEEIRKTDLVDEETLRKIASYLSVD